MLPKLASPSPDTSTSTAVARRFGRYRTERMLGSGAMGAVYAATDELLNRRVAVKTVTVRGGTSDLFKRRFLNEARAVAALSHPNIVPIFDLGFEDDVPFLVMELAPGPTLKDRIADAPLSPDEVRQLGIQLAQALKAAHGGRIIHRDVKPANVLESEPGVWKLVDFGVAHVPDSSLTMTGQFVGSVAYAAPESLALGQFSAAADIYGLGATLYEAASGQRPHDEASVSSLTALLARPAPRALHEMVPGFPRELSAAILRALAADAEERPTAGELAGLLAHADASPARTTAGRPRRWLLVALAVVGCGSAIAVARGMGSEDAGAAPAVIPTPAREPTSPAQPIAIAQPAPAPPTPTVTPTPVAAPAADIPGLAAIRRAVLAGGWNTAPIVKLRKRYPTNAEIPYLLGLAHFHHRWDSEGAKAFKAAIALDPAYRSDERLIVATLRGFRSVSYPWQVVRLLQDDIGAPAVPYLEEIATKHANSRVRQLAKRVLAGMPR